MANHTSSKKMIRKIERNTDINRRIVSAMRTSIKKLEKMIAQGDQSQATALFSNVERTMRKAVSKGVIKLNTASRKISRLSQHVKKLQKAS